MRKLFFVVVLLLSCIFSYGQSNKHPEIVDGFEYVFSKDIAGHPIYHILDAAFYDRVKDYPVDDSWVSDSGELNEIREVDNLFIHVIHNPKYEDVKTSVVIVY